jgi:hypothetical protein
VATRARELLAELDESLLELDLDDLEFDDDFEAGDDDIVVEDTHSPNSSDSGDSAVDPHGQD